MTVRLLRPYGGQTVNTLYTGSDEMALKATGNADDQLEAASDYAAFRRQQQGDRLNAGGLPPALASTGLNIRNLKASNTLKIRAAMANPSRNALVATLGPSTTGGQTTGGGTAQAVNSWPMQLARQLQAQGINAGANNFFGNKAGWGAGSSAANFLSGDSRVTLTGAAAPVGNGSLGGNAFGLGVGGAASALGFTPPGAVTKFDIYYAEGSAGRTFSWSVDGGAATNIATTGGTGMAKATVSAGTSGPHTLTLTYVSGGTCLIFGVVAYDDTGGRREISIVNVGWSGATSAALSTPERMGYLGNLAPDLTIIDDWAINDWRQNVPIETFQNNLAIGIAQAKVTGDAIVTTPLWDGATMGSSANQDAYAAATIATALAADVPVLDVRSAWVSYAAANAAGMYSDTVHPATLGYGVKGSSGHELFRRIRAI